MEQTIIEVINNVGFPIAVSVALFWQNSKSTEMYNRTLGEFKEVINDNTKTLTSLIDKMDKKWGD